MGLNIPSEDDSSSSLDVIVEAAVGVTVAVEVLESLLALEVLELDDHVGVDVLNSLHELVHELLLDAYGNTLLAKTKVQGVLEVGLVVSAGVNDNRQSLARVNASSSSVQGQLANLMRRLASEGCVQRCEGVNLRRCQHRLHPSHQVQECESRQ